MRLAIASPAIVGNVQHRQLPPRRPWTGVVGAGSHGSWGKSCLLWRSGPPSATIRGVSAPTTQRKEALGGKAPLVPLPGTTRKGGTRGTTTAPRRRVSFHLQRSNALRSTAGIELEKKRSSPVWGRDRTDRALSPGQHASQAAERHSCRTQGPWPACVKYRANDHARRARAYR